MKNKNGPRRRHTMPKKTLGPCCAIASNYASGSATGSWAALCGFLGSNIRIPDAVVMQMKRFLYGTL